MNSPDIKKLRVKVDIVKTYYVQTPDGWIYGGPFDTKSEAIDCLREAKIIDAQHPILDPPPRHQNNLRAKS